VSRAPKVRRLLWRELREELREALAGKLKGLYGAESDASAFDSLAVDKQQALLLLARRLRELGLWGYVRRVENVYGRGGVGMNLSAWPGLSAELRGRKDFTARFARHRDNAGGFIERGRDEASLHLLYQGDAGGRSWGVHFDLYSPWSSPRNIWRHLFYEKLGRVTPDWQMIYRALARPGK
jgi:hypothetical protein